MAYRHVGTKPEFTKTQQSILHLLSDGARHSVKQLHGILPDELSSYRTVAKHICLIREKLRARGEDIVCEYYQRRLHYRHVRLISYE